MSMIASDDQQYIMIKHMIFKMNWSVWEPRNSSWSGLYHEFWEEPIRSVMVVYMMCLIVGNHWNQKEGDAYCHETQDIAK